MERMEKMERIERRKTYKKSIAFTLIMAMLMSTVGFGGGLFVRGGSEAYSVVDPVSEAVSTTLTGYYGTHENYVLDDWDEMAAVKASGGDLEDYQLPATPASGSPSVISSLLKGDITAAGIAAANMVSSTGILNSSGYAYGDAFNIIAVEAYNRSVLEEEKIQYSTVAAINTLLAYRTTVEGISNQFYALDYYTHNPYSDIDGAGLAVVALSIFTGDSVVEEAKMICVGQLKNAQTINGDFSGAWGPNANTSAIAVLGLVAAEEDLSACYTSSAAIKTPIEGLLTYYVSDGGFGYDNSNSVNAYATKQATLAIADIKNRYSYYANLSAGAINYISAKGQVIGVDGIYAEKNLTMGGDKTIAKAIQRVLATSGAILYEDYNVYVNGMLESAPESVTASEGNTILAVAKKYTKVAYFKVSDADDMGVNNTTVAFGGSKEITLFEKILVNGEESVLAGKPINYGTALVSNYGITDANGKVTITPVESKLEYEISAKYSAYDFNTASMKEYITSDTAILPAVISMSAGTPQTATVSLRIEGPNSNIYYNTAFTAARPDGSRLTVFDAVTQALENNEIQYVESKKYISSIDGIAAGTFGIKHWDGWMYKINGASSNNGMGTQFISGGEEIVVYYGNDNMSTVYPNVTNKLESDGSVTIGIKNDEMNWTTYEISQVPTPGVTVYWGYTSGTALTYPGTTDVNGIFSIPAEYAAIGQHSLQISKGAVNLPDVIRLAPNYNIIISASGTSGGSGSTSTVDVAYLTVKGSNGNLKPKTSYAWYQNMTALNILQSSGLRIETDSSGNYVQSVEGVGEFDLGKNSGWLYSVNGVTPTNKASNLYILKANDNVLWYYTLDFTKDSSSSSWVDIEVKNAAELAATIDSTGKATAIITNDNLDKLIKGGTDSLKVISNLATLTFDQIAMKAVSEVSTGDVKIAISKVDISKFSQMLKTEIGDRLVYDFTVTSGSKTISDFNGKVTVNIPYLPLPEEDINALVIYYINDAGKLETVKNCTYDSATKTMTFSTDHFSSYVVGYAPVAFADISGHWSAENIQFLAARGIIKGKSEGMFMPNDAISRVEFVTILGNKYGVDFSKYSTSDFGDVKDSNWFAGAVAWASENGIVTGYNGMFRPNDNISRQEMAVVLDRYMTNIEEIESTEINEPISFLDDPQIASYAKESVAKMQQFGIINGKTLTEFMPLDNATRGEAAKMIKTLILINI